jgi:hypothetical protein
VEGIDVPPSQAGLARWVRGFSAGSINRLGCWCGPRWRRLRALAFYIVHAV